MTTTPKPGSPHDHEEEEEDTFDPMDLALQRILQEVLNDRAGIIGEALRTHCIYGIDELISLTLPQMQALTMIRIGVKTRSQQVSVSEEGKQLPREPLALGFVGALHCFKGYIWWYMLGQGKRPDFASLSRDDFNDFRISPNWNPEILFSSNPPGLVPKTPSRSSADDFRRGIKRDQSHYTVFKEDKQWDSWRRATISTARAHACDEVFDPSYKPKDKENKDLFDEKQKFIYSVFESILRTDMGKYFVRQHEHDYDAQTVFCKLEQYAVASTQATIDSSGLLAYLTSAKLDSHWRGTAQSFILHWCDKLRTYEDLIPKTDHFSDAVKMSLLQNTVTSVNALHQVKLVYA